METKHSYIIDLNELDRHQIDLVGGKAANLGELCKIEGVDVPAGFCVTTSVFKELLSNHQSIKLLLAELAQQNMKDQGNIRMLCSRLRSLIEQLVIPKQFVDEIAEFLTMTGIRKPYAVRSSATAEDLPLASFAGQQDSYLNVIGRESILQHITKCWASLFTERAVIYRIQNNIPPDEVSIAVVVQQMVFSEVSGVMFTADPVTSNRKRVSIDAVLGLGEVLVVGKVNPDRYAFRDGRITEKSIAAKTLALYANPSGGTIQKDIPPEYQNSQALPDEQILQLAQLGRRIEEHFGAPQDIEWCRAENRFYFVQSRPITTLFPIPAPIQTIYGNLKTDPAIAEPAYKVYISVGHNQMMTDAMKPLGLSFFLMVTNAPMFIAAGRLFVDVTRQLASPDSNNKLIETFRNADPLIADALLTVSSRKDIFPGSHRVQNPGLLLTQPDSFQPGIKNDPAIVRELINSIQHSNQLLADAISSKSGLDLLDFIKNDMQELKRIVFNPESMAVIMTAINASFWLNAKMKEWLDETNVADIISQSVDNNISSEMGLALLDLADKIRLYPGVIQYLEGIPNELNPEALTQIKGGQETMNAITSCLDKFGMRCVGEIDITRTRLAEKPATLVPLILSHIKNFEAGESARRFAIGLRNAEQKENDLLERLKQLPDGEKKAKETRRVISYIRNFIGFREYPKYGKICRYFLYRQAFLNEAAELVKAEVIKQVDDIYYLSFEELYDVIRSKYLDDAIISRRKADHKFFEKLIPPRVITSHGEIISGRYANKNLPEGALMGLAVSSGIVEGRARIILSMEGAELEKGDILVTRFTDPSWTPFFVSVKGLVTEVGGLMTHGAVVAREYGLPAVVGVENATKLIRDGQRIRVHGTAGYVELLT